MYNPFRNINGLEILQQILFFKELDLPLKEIKKIMTRPSFNKMQALESHKKLIVLKRNRLNDLIELVDKTLKGEAEMSFKEFDMSEYYNVLEEFKTEHEDRIIKFYGSVDKYNEFVEKCKSKEAEIAKMAVKQYGSIEKYAKAVKKNLDDSIAMTYAERIDEFKKEFLYDKHPKLKELYKKLTADLSKDPSSEEIQQIAGEITNTAKKEYEVFSTNFGEHYWYGLVRFYSIYPDWIEKVDKKYGNGASKFIGKALKIYSENNKICKQLKTI